MWVELFDSPAFTSGHELISQFYSCDFTSHFNTLACLCVNQEFNLNSNVVFMCHLQAKYKEAGKKEANTCLYSLLPETLETQHAKETTELLSEVKSSRTHRRHAETIRPHLWGSRLFLNEHFLRSSTRRAGRKRCPARFTRLCPTLQKPASPERWLTCWARYQPSQTADVLKDLKESVKNILVLLKSLHLEWNEIR